ncbi:uncharacterized protein LOC125178564 [Hyalella azteca]|uniref:Uncharacterized protein LOC125178564 n=1 Tax=Hyalella azteca TaxID=294128 RepID=A0A979FPM0_HYAAZ|nr:uncharacterized protein LOC125178564 [Hyalella azteca]
MFKFKKKEHAPHSSSTCEGQYIIQYEKGLVNNKLVYVNIEKSTVLAAHPSTGWCITHLNYWDEIKDKQGSFGGFHFGGGETPADNIWQDFSVIEPKGFIFVSKPSTNNYAKCDGVYVYEDRIDKINGRDVYVNRTNGKFLAGHPNSGWCITDLCYLDEVQRTQGAFGGFHSVSSFEPEDGNWASYEVSKFGPFDAKHDTIYKKSSWVKHENTTVSFKAVANSGVVRTDEDFHEMRKRCISLNCGGFAWRKPHYNQYGEEDDPPVCFFYRRSQNELRLSFVSSDKYDFYIAPEKFCPDCRFVPFRDPAPSCHVNWLAGRPVHSFACQIVVPFTTSSTYYCVGGFHCGYSGIQQHCDQKQQILFSVWNDSCASSKVKNCCVYPGIVAKPFGGEGMGMQAIGVSGDTCGSSDCSLAAWTPGTAYTFVIRAYPLAGGTEFACYVHKPHCGWQLVARHERPEAPRSARGKLEDLYSFIEDFSGNSLRRRANFAAWVQLDPGAQWEPVRRIKGTSTADKEVPNKSVRLVTENSYQKVELVSGGEALEHFSLYEGYLSNPLPVPDILKELGK